MSFAGKWVEVEIMMLVYIGQAQKDKYSMYPHPAQQ
jgi:hypothetical protein